MRVARPGLSAALGFALADRFRGSDARIFAMVSDGKLEEGQVGEAALFAPYLFGKYGLSTSALVETIWSALGCAGAPPAVPVVAAAGGEYSPV